MYMAPELFNGNVYNEKVVSLKARSWHSNSLTFVTDCPPLPLGIGSFLPPSLGC